MKLYDGSITASPVHALRSYYLLFSFYIIICLSFPFTSYAIQAPNGWNVLNSGNDQNEFLGINEEKNTFKAQVGKDSLLGLQKSFSGDVRIISKVTDAPVTKGTSWGVFLSTKGGANFKLLRVNTDKGVIIRFTISSNKTIHGKKVIQWNKGDAILILERKGDLFSGIVRSLNKSISTKVGTMEWPDLASQGSGGIIAIYKGSLSDGPQKETFLFSDLTLGPPGNQAQTNETIQSTPPTAHSLQNRQDQVQTTPPRVSIQDLYNRYDDRERSRSQQIQEGGYGSDSQRMNLETLMEDLGNMETHSQ
ncbi:MAG: hypothetical protein HOJ48_12235 [Desulfobacula sp.]|nr:hypothetical protein [Desulfobacula sp.]MBT7262261.1 hypothetical protein [Desulfobacula sp.]